MSGKYIDFGTTEGALPPGPNLCSSKGEGIAWDPRDNTCYPLYGVAVVIADTVASYQAGFETFNANVHMSKTQRPYVSCEQIEGPMVRMA